MRSRARHFSLFLNTAPNAIAIINLIAVFPTVIVPIITDAVQQKRIVREPVVIWFASKRINGQRTA